MADPGADQPATAGAVQVWRDPARLLARPDVSVLGSLVG